MNEKKQANNKQQPVHVIHSEDKSVTAQLFVFQSPTGFRYLGFTLSRRWNRLTTNKETQGDVFFQNSGTALIEVVQKATEWLRAEACAASAVEETNKQLSTVRRRSINASDESFTDRPRKVVSQTPVPTGTEQGHTPDAS